MKLTKSLFTAAALTLALATHPARSEDIDLYTGGSSGGDANVLIVLDNASNWAANGYSSSPPADADLVANCGGKTSTYYCAQKYALIKLLKQTNAAGYVVGEKVGIGLMMYGDSNNKGGYIRFGVRRMTPANRAALIKVLYDMPISDKGSSNQDFGWMMWEAFKYFGGGSGSPTSSTAFGPIPTNGVGSGTDKRDYPTNMTAGSAHTAGADTNYAYTLSSTTLSGAGRVEYVPPGHPTDCGKNYIVYIGHSESQPNNNNADAQALFIGVGGSSTRVSPGSASSADEGARYLFNSDVDPTKAGTQNVITYTIGTYDPPCKGNDVCGMIDTMKSMARQGGGSYYDATDIQQLAKDFEAILTEIQGVNSAFVSASLPVSVNTQGTFLNQVFVGMFRPDTGGSPKWLGNLKQYQLKYDAVTNTVRMADADGLDAIDAGSGFVSVLARSFWTTDSQFWKNWVPGKTATESDSKDGPEVQKGGAAQRQREANLTTQANRKVYTCAVDAAGAPNCTANAFLSATPYNTTTLDPAKAGTKAAFNYPPTTAGADIADLVKWVRGTDYLGNESGPETVPATTVRPTIHGDVLHSRPVALNYGGPGLAPRVVVYYASNDGMLRAIEGRQTGTLAGEEIWAFVAPEHLKNLSRLRDESPKLSLPSVAGSTTNKDYFLDGPIGAYQEGSTAIIYVAARRGGNFIYAIDVSDPNNPKFKFKLDKNTTGLSDLGQTWSMPKVTKVRDGTASGRVVLVFGGGYDTAEDTNAHGTSGRGVYVVDALTGTVIKQFLNSADGAISTSIPSDVTIVNVDKDAKGFVDRAYVGDLAGNVWRMDLDDPSSSTNDPSRWKLHKLASLGAGKFFYPPDVVLGATFHAVVLGSGDREKPLVQTSGDRFYMLKDMKLGLDGTGQTPIAESDLALNTANSTSKKGWYYKFGDGEKVVNAPLTIGGVVYFGTNKPITAGACKSNLGEARSYAMSFFDGSGTRAPGGVGTGDTAYSQVLTGGGLPPSPIAGLVEIDRKIVAVCLGCGERRSAFEAGIPTIDPNPVRRKLYWKFKNDK